MEAEVLYQPLPHPKRSIRLLSIVPGWPADPVSVGLVVIQDVEEAPKYDALSYVWGLTYHPDPILCNGVPKRVTKSLGEALRTFRPLPSNDEQEAHNRGLHLIRDDDVLHSKKHIWRDIAGHRWEKPLESRTEPFLIWVDALCINQDDLNERANQVEGMREIYERAQNVRVWFGEQLDYVTDAEFVPRISSSWLDRLLGRVSLSEYGDMPVVLAFLAQAFHNSKQTSHSHDERIHGFPPTYAPEWEILRKFFQHPWFYRVWTVQEIVMARRAIVVVGDWEIDWDPFAAAVNYLYGTYYAYSLEWKSTAIWKVNAFSSSWKSLPLNSVAYMCRIKSDALERPLLMPLLHLGRTRKATQPVDYVFAVLNLSADWYTVDRKTTVSPFIVPDYTKSIASTFTDVAIWLISFHRSLDVLSFVAHEGEHLPECPSWVPVWSHTMAAWPLAHGEFSSFPQYSRLKSPLRRLLGPTGYNASLDEPMMFPPVDNLKSPRVLKATGLNLSRVVLISEALIPPGKGSLTLRNEATTEEKLFIESAWNLCEYLMAKHDSHDGIPSRHELHSDTLNSITPYTTRQEIQDALILTLCANRSKDWKRADQDKDVREDAVAWLKHTIGSRLSQATFADQMLGYFTQKGSRESFQSTVSLICSWRRFFLTQSGHMGIGPMTMRQGDEVVILFGSTSPFVIRAQGDAPSRYALIGECYVHGVMDGELVAEWRTRSDSRASTFEFE